MSSSSTTDITTPAAAPASEPRPFCTKILKGHAPPVQSVAYTPDGRFIVSGSGDKSIHIWEVATGETVGAPLEPNDQEIWELAISPDGKKIVSVYLGSYPARIWDFETRRLIHTFDAGVVFSLAISPDSRYVVTGSGSNILQKWDLETGAQVTGPMEGHTNAVAAVAWSVDGEKLASTSYDGTTRVWGAADGSPVAGPFRVDHLYYSRSIVFSHDGSQIILGVGNGDIQILDTQDGRLRNGPLTGHKGAVVSLALSPDGRRIASASIDGTVCIWDSATGRLAARPLNNGEMGRGMTYSPDGKYVASSGADGNTRIWDVEAAIASYIASVPKNGTRNTNKGELLDSSILDLPATADVGHAQSGHRVPSGIQKVTRTHVSDPAYDSILDLPATLEPHPGGRPPPRRAPKAENVATDPPAPPKASQPGRLTRLWARFRPRTPRRGSSTMMHPSSGVRNQPAAPPVVDVPHAQDFPRVVIAAPRDRKTRARRARVVVEDESDDGSDSSDEYEYVGCLDYICFLRCCSR
ncbi:WD40 repeat-like protein [Leucogyrophana mollusca]|uniref:WD40 repeat-like protein n=1 Tax=Leucogyrophana mollusca TaxID=85980 RepID=A0ACB8BWV7_9AGAM|nr:WD40 repeat-like protein [Leucogyrophana mollusca]